VWERFLLVCDWHNQRCKRKAQKEFASTHKKP